jgi:hypothetical protein
MSFLWNHHGGVDPKDLLLTIWPCLNVVLTPFSFEKLKPFGSEHVGMNINHRHGRGLLMVEIEGRHHANPNGLATRL